MEFAPHSLLAPSPQKERSNMLNSKKSEKRTCFTGISDKRWYSFEKQGPSSIQFGQPFGLVSGKREGKLQTLDNST